MRLRHRSLAAPSYALLLLAACAAAPPASAPEAAEVPILMYHHVGDWGPARDDWAPWVVRPDDFSAQLDWLVAHGYRSITFAEWLAHRDAGAPLPEHPVILTFDDGWGEDVDIARRYLAPRGLRGVFFVFTGAVGGAPYLTWDQVRELSAAGHEIEAHTVSHPDLRQVADAQLANELRDGKARIERELHQPAEVLAYPFGLCDERVAAAAAAAGYRLAVLAEGGNAGPGAPPLRLPRWKMAYGEPIERFAALLPPR